MKSIQKPLLLVSNDDGVYSEGIRELTKALQKIGEVVVVAPDQERSAASHSLTLHRPLRVKRLRPLVYSVDGTPTDCITLGVNEILKKKRPNLIVSGINKGANLGDDVHYSGTVSAALEGGIMGIPSIAISMMPGERYHFETAAAFAIRLVRKILAAGMPAGIILNVNVPNVPKKQIKGYRFTKQGKRDYGDIIAERIDPRGKKYYWIGGNMAGFMNIAGSDCNAVLENYISITPIRANLTEHEFLESLSQWQL